jgi:hypothetical protein
MCGKRQPSRKVRRDITRTLGTDSFFSTKMTVSVDKRGLQVPQIVSSKLLVRMTLACWGLISGDDA